MEHAEFPFDLITLFESLDDIEASQVLGFGKIGTTSGFMAAAKTSQRRSEIKARLVSEGLQDVGKDLGGFFNLAGSEQLLATVRMRNIPGLRAFLATCFFGPGLSTGRPSFQGIKHTAHIFPVIYERSEIPPVPRARQDKSDLP